MKLIITEKDDKRSKTVIKITGVIVDTLNNQLVYVMASAPNSISVLKLETVNHYFITQEGK